MQAVILAAGEGIQLKDSREIIPKCLIKVGKKTIIENTLGELPNEIEEVIIVVGKLKQFIKKQVGVHCAGKRIRYVEQTEPLGTGHALLMAKPLLNGRKFVVLMGDDLYLKKDIENSLKHGLSLLAHEIEHPERFGVLKIARGSLDGIEESPKLPAGSLANCGLYVLDERIFDYPLVKEGEEYGLPQAIAKMSQDHPVQIVKASFWLPVSTVQDLKKADKYLKKLYL